MASNREISVNFSVMLNYATKLLQRNRTNNFLKRHLLTNSSQQNYIIDEGIEEDQETELNMSYMLFTEFVANYILPIVIALGFVGNVFVISMLRWRPRRSSIHVYMTCLALLNAIILLSGSGYTWLCVVLQMNHVSDMTGWTCRLWQFAYNGVLLYAPNWLLVAMLADQLALLSYPLTAKELCTCFRAKFNVLAIFVGHVTVAIHSLWTYELQMAGCYINMKQRDFLTVVWPYVSASVCLYLPIVVILIMIVLLAHAIINERRRRSPLPLIIFNESHNHNSDRQSNGTSSTTGTSSVATMTGGSATLAVRPHSRRPKLVLIQAIAFAVSLLPGTVVNVIGHVWTHWTMQPLWFPTMLLCQLTSCLSYASSAVIFPICDASIRRQIGELLFARRQQRHQPLPSSYADIELLAVAEDRSNEVTTIIDNNTTNADVALLSPDVTSV